MDIVVVYKVDRLTRSLADFARLVELFDAEGVSFVSVTQQFNTTSSAACAGSRRRPTVSHEMQDNGEWHRARRQTLLARSSLGGHLYTVLSNPIYTGKIAPKDELHPGQQPALIDDESGSAVRDQLSANTSDHRRRAKAAKPGRLVDAMPRGNGSRHHKPSGRADRTAIAFASCSDAVAQSAA
jgi:Resolvase, N terminal domain